MLRRARFRWEKAEKEKAGDGAGGLASVILSISVSL